MKLPIGKAVLALLLIALGSAGWLATLWAASEWWAGVASTSMAVVLIAAAFRGRFASREQARDFWTGFAVFGLVHFLLPSGVSGVQSMTSAVVDFGSVRVLGPDNPWGRPDLLLTPLGRSLQLIPVGVGGGSLFSYLSYIRTNNKLFASLVFGTLGGLAACHIRHRKVRSSGTGGCPLLGMAWLSLLSVLIGAVLLIHAHPEFVLNPVFPTCPGSEAANFALLNIEILAVLFAVFEARFGSERDKAWWLGFALFGCGYLVCLGSQVGPLPTVWITEIFPWVYHRFVSNGPTPWVQVGGIIMFGQETEMFFRAGSTWAGLATFLPVAWVGTLVARLFERLGTINERPGWLDRMRVRSGIGRLMMGLAGVGVFLAVVKNPNPTSVVIEANLLVGLLLFAALRGCFGPRTWRAWWWGFALVGAVDLLYGAHYDSQPGLPEYHLTRWPIHGVVAHLHRQEVERQFGQPIPYFMTFDSLDEPGALEYYTYQNSRPLVLLALCLPLAWIGALVAKWLEHRSQSSEIGQERELTSEYPPVHQ